jgi:hypothetical protein
MSVALETCVRALEIREPSCVDRPTRLYLMLEARGPQGIVGRVTALKPSR